MDRYVTHATFSLERDYPVSPARVFAAWADPAAKARWFAPSPGARHELDFRVGGREVAHGGPEGGPMMTFESIYRDIVPPQRIVYTSTMLAGDELITVSLTTVEFRPAEAGISEAGISEAGTPEAGNPRGRNPRGRNPAGPHRAGDVPGRPGGAGLAGSRHRRPARRPRRGAQGRWLTSRRRSRPRRTRWSPPARRRACRSRCTSTAT